MIAGNRKSFGILLAAIFAVVALAMATALPARAHAAQGGAQLTTAASAASKGAVAPGDYWIQSGLSGTFMLDVRGGLRSDGANVQIWVSNKTGAQKWRIADAGGGTYTIKCVGTGKYLDAQGGIASNGRNVWQYARNGTAAQRWYIEADGSGWTIRSAVNRKYVLDVLGGSRASGTNVQLYRANSTAAQRWYLWKAAPRVASERTVADGVYELRLGSASGYTLDVAGASSANYANVQLYKSNKTLAQRWYVRWESDGYYSLRCMGSGKMLDVAGGGVASGTDVWQYASNSTDAQRWAISASSGGTYVLTCKANGLSLDAAGAKGANGTNVRVYMPTGRASQRWQLKSVKLLDPGVYSVYSLLGGGQAVDIAGASRSAGVQAQTYAYNGTMAQRLVLSEVAEGTFTMRAVCSGLYLADSSGKVVQQKGTGAAARWRASYDGSGIAFTNVATGRRMAVSGGKAASGSKLVTAKASSRNAQRFRMEATQLVPNGYFEVRSAASTGRTLDVVGGSSSSGANVQLYGVNSTAAQAWYVQHVGGGYYKLVNDGSGKALEASGSNVRQGSYSGAAAQLWRPELQAGGTFAFVNKGSGSALAAAGTSNGSNVGQAARTGASSQRWRLVSTSSRGLSGNAELDAYVRSIVKRNGYDLRSCYDELTSMKSVGAMDSEILSSGIVSDSKTRKYAMYVMRRNESDCYGASALFTYVARACGYSANFRAGAVPSDGGPEEHGWTEVYVNGKTYVCDVSLGRYIYYRNWYMVTYDNAPTEYLR